MEASQVSAEEAARQQRHEQQPGTAVPLAQDCYETVHWPVWPVVRTALPSAHWNPDSDEPELEVTEP